MDQTIASIERVEVTDIGTSGHTLMIILSGGSRVPVACPSWHVDYTGYITFPPTPNNGGHYHEEWLADVCHGITVKSTKLRVLLLDWLSTADLSPLDDDETDAWDALSASLMNRIRLVQQQQAQ
jgi:hypothetical protein